MYSITYLIDRLVTETFSTRAAAVRRARILSVNSTENVRVATPAGYLVTYTRHGYAVNSELNVD